MFLDRKLLEKGLEELGIPATEEQLSQLDRFSELLFKWNKTYNLTAIRSKEDLLTHHILDSLAVIPQLKTYLSRGGRILDVGSGGGLPAIPLAIMIPEVNVTMVDAVGKKVAFLTQCCLSLNLCNARAVHSRVEKMQDEPYDIITSRAFAALDLFTELTKSLLKTQGVWLALKGPGVGVEYPKLSSDVVVSKVFRIRVPFLEEERCLVELKRLDI